MQHKDVENYNWDDGLDRIWNLVHDQETDQGTALLIYWRIEGPFLEMNICQHNMDLWRMKRTLEERILSGFYKNNKIHYDPISDYNLSKLQVVKLLRKGLDSKLIGKIFG